MLNKEVINMVYQRNFHGIISPVSTILDKNNNLDEKGMKKLIDYLIKERVHGLLFLGSGGEFSQMTLPQRKKITEFCISYVNKRVPVFIGTGSTSTKEAILLSQHAQQSGSDGVLIITPYYWPLLKKDLLKYYKDIANAIDLPIILYNFPSLTGQVLSPESILELINYDKNIIGVKETVDSVEHIREVIVKVKKKHPEFLVFAGMDDHLLNTLQMGGDGAIPGASNFVPEITVGIYELYKKKEYIKAEELLKKLMQLLQIYELSSPPFIAIKEAIKARGVDIPTQVLPPAQNLDKASKLRINEILSSTFK